MEPMERTIQVYYASSHLILSRSREINTIRILWSKRETLNHWTHPSSLYLRVAVDPLKTEIISQLFVSAHRSEKFCAKIYLYDGCLHGERRDTALMYIFQSKRYYTTLIWAITHHISKLDFQSPLLLQSAIAWSSPRGAEAKAKFERRSTIEV